jgi:hypothetical protein
MLTEPSPVDFMGNACISVPFKLNTYNVEEVVLYGMWKLISVVLLNECQEVLLLPATKGKNS